MSEREIITEIGSRKNLLSLIEKSDEMIVLKFGAEWCKPCKKIEPVINGWFQILPGNVKCGILDVDEEFDIYAFYKRQKIITTIPAILRFNGENKSVYPDEAIFSSDEAEVNVFFQRIINDA